MSKYIRIGVSVLLLAVIAWRMNWTDVAQKFANLRVELWFVAVGMLVLAQLASAKRWQFFARELRFERSLMQCYSYYCIGMYFNLSLPTSVGGDVVRVWYLNGQTGRKWAAFASVFLERLNGLVVFIAFACIGILNAPMELPSWIALSVWGVAGCAALGLAALPLLLRWQKLPPQQRLQLQLMAQLLKAPRVLAGATLMSVAVQVVGVFCLWCLGASLSLDIPLAYYFILGPMVSLLTLLPISFNGMGLRELGMVVFLAPLGIDKDTATTLGFLWFSVNAAVSLGGGLVYLFGAFPKAQTTPDLALEEADEHGTIDRDSDQGREGQFNQAA